ncbi:hypothetical protein L1D24_08240 [Vibrio brasiliensis]|uniref:hypothetical protein n=1 Tax=Vibrio brasiliensis TaxID=170652 RepID=UPI001EFD6BA7|nr:hypothetical protein [Vibrio brasiliensis]MCG9648561.1 hypothetical protein [Vibrio brasiliensis]
MRNKKMKKLIPCTISLLITTVLSGCNDGSGTSPSIENTLNPLITPNGVRLELNSDNVLVDSTGTPITDPLGNEAQLLLDEQNNFRVGANGGYLTVQTDAQGELVENEILLNSSGEVWLDGNNNLVLATTVPGPGSLENSTPSPLEQAATLVGLMKEPPKPAPVVFAASTGAYYNVYYHSMIAATNDGNYMVFGGKTDHYNTGSNTAKRFDIDTGNIVESSDNWGIITTVQCEFNPELLESRFHTPPSLSEIENSPELGCLPNNARQLPAAQHTGLNGVLTATNELWGIGNAQHGLGGKLSGTEGHAGKLTLPVKIADNIKLTTSHSSSPIFSYLTNVLTNSGDVFEVGRNSTNGGHAVDAQNNHVMATSPEAVDKAFVKLTSPEDDFIINVVPKYSIQLRNAAVAIGTSGEYYYLTPDSAQPIGLDFEEVKAAISVNSFAPGDGRTVGLLNFINNEGKLRQIRLDTMEQNDYNGSYYKSSNPTEELSLENVVFSSMVSSIGALGILKDNAGNYYSHISISNSFLNLGSNGGKLMQLEDNIPVIAFLKANPDYEFLFNEPRILINRKDKKLAVVDTGGYDASASVSGVNFYTEEARTGNRDYGNVYILPDSITNKLWLEE